MIETHTIDFGRPNHYLELVGLIPIAIVTYLYDYTLGVLVLFTGCLYHLNPCLETYVVDVYTVIGACTYANIYTIWQPYVFTLTMIALVAAVYNAQKHDWRVHIFLVDLPLSIATMQFAMQMFESQNKM